MGEHLVHQRVGHFARVGRRGLRLQRSVSASTAYTASRMASRCSSGFMRVKPVADALLRQHLLNGRPRIPVGEDMLDQLAWDAGASPLPPGGLAVLGSEIAVALVIVVVAGEAQPRELEVVARKQRFQARKQAPPAAIDGDAGALVVIGLATDGLDRGGDGGFAILRFARAGDFGVEHGKLHRAAPIAMLLDQRGSLVEIGAGARDAALGELDACAQQMRIRQEQRHAGLLGDGFGLAKRLARSARIAAAPQRFGMSEKAARQVIFRIRAAQGGKRRRRERRRNLRRGRGGRNCSQRRASLS